MSGMAVFKSVCGSLESGGGVAATTVLSGFGAVRAMGGTTVCAVRGLGASTLPCAGALALASVGISAGFPWPPIFDWVNHQIPAPMMAIDKTSTTRKKLLCLMNSQNDENYDEDQYRKKARVKAPRYEKSHHSSIHTKLPSGTFSKSSLTSSSLRSTQPALTGVPSFSG